MITGRDNIGEDGLLSTKVMPFIECPFDIFQPSPPTLRLELRSIHFWPAGAEPGFKLCGTTLANPCDGNATALAVVYCEWGFAEGI